MIIAAAQISTTENKKENLDKCLAYIRLAAQQNARIIVLPEMSMALVTAENGIKPTVVAEPIDGPFVKALQKAAAVAEAYVICGIFECVEGNEKQAYNSLVVINPDGSIERVYRKTHLYDAFSYRESDTILKGDELFEPLDTPFGKIGLMVCYELRFPEIARQLSIQGADMIIIPAGWVKGPMKETHWDILLKARAIENTVFVCGCNQTGSIYTGRSALVDPMGKILKQLESEEGVISDYIDRNLVAETRKKVPCLANRRPDIYRI
ncbi:carbon-nitrogen hydrolase family protein [Bacillus testis]|uniref:carbon-nitrogen hydrolase family protein n=1 Tax=Bacillus testis TaxID=1622072 RepID=UPI00067F3732|nr:carbon-nitrogen hydrolase family protein [Bacillus testis]